MLMNLGMTKIITIHNRKIKLDKSCYGKISATRKYFQRIRIAAYNRIYKYVRSSFTALIPEYLIWKNWCSPVYEGNKNLHYRYCSWSSYNTVSSYNLIFLVRHRWNPSWIHNWARIPTNACSVLFREFEVFN